MIPKDELVAELPNALTFERYPMLRERIFELFSLSTIEPNAVLMLVVIAIIGLGIYQGPLGENF